MKRSALFLLPAMGAIVGLSVPVAAQAPDLTPAAVQEDEMEVPQWLADLSNLPREQRQEYIETFTAAKVALAQGDWVTCDALLTTCELIFRGNPHISNMRAVCYIEQKRFTDAEAEVAKAKQELPNDPTTLVNIATLHMAQGQYQACIDEMTDIIEANRYTVRQDVLDILTFRMFLCHLMMGNEMKALELVQDVSPLCDTPLYYYSRAAVCLFKKDLTGAKGDLQSAARIFDNNAAQLAPYQRALLNCRLSVPEEKSVTTGSNTL